MKVVHAHVYIQNSAEMRKQREEGRDPEMEEGRETGEEGMSPQPTSPPPDLLLGGNHFNGL